MASDTGPFERMEAFFTARGYETHRHDTYAIGITLNGAQSFHYRGALRTSLPGNGTMVLHPDEPHDGQAGAEDGFHYRMIYVEPSAIQDVLRGRPLPFIDGGISADPRLRAATSALLPDTGDRIERLEYEDGIFDLAQALATAGAAVSPEHRRRFIDYTACERARQWLDAYPATNVSLEELELAAGKDRWALSRDFRRLYGTSPHRYLVMRRLARVRQSLRCGHSLAAAAIDAGFTDQSHMTRHFKKTFGISPGRWLATLQAAGRAQSYNTSAAIGR
ncbi:AraC family transcriptional regulator [Phyllobacterium sp. 0TCS1.6C]|uniref:AraC family transcriptional regulator n=1 Tax=unclassified Phyllobacterium TaxID=2638441 RepID=UPI002263DF43|nr:MULTISPECIES: AraC family transcriptional regulator [unclassified Phyllobacterium]MCX8280836.1 AraC family transcriptional regulator [Phyllobacterium sp. 0TCS1.6C]MCX8295702.1 AraC family transcriptional regulator [Phyllobacterium sp. 0TCS1.6A]